MMIVQDALGAWRESLLAWAIPEEILARAPESPWQLPKEVFTRRADTAIERRSGTLQRRAQEALEPHGSVLDVGAGSGAASLPLGDVATSLAAVDTDSDMLEELRARAQRLGLRVTLIAGRWPEMAEATPVADVVVCSHVLYNVPDLAPFVQALTRHARRRVCVEITAHHPLRRLNPLWLRFHNLQRPDGPTWEDAARALSALGVAPQVEREKRPDEPPILQSFSEVVALTRRRLCLRAERDAEVARALQEMGFDSQDPRTWTLRDPELVILWWTPPEQRGYEP